MKSGHVERMLSLPCDLNHLNNMKHNPLKSFAHGLEDDKVCWTKWYDRDDPSGTGDWESLSDLRRENRGEICARPIAIESKTVDTGTPAAQTGQHFLHFSTTVGFVCKNGPDQYCKDYQVRFRCPCRLSLEIGDAIP
ncbi:cartilage intermediate layer protein 1-like isoform X2 [Hypomesus transpacificus]|uniref:cartilage intermediate layer protein 1-like isoform X2 n=1 Tax=Hypomesus transpacificus TaxID=137520 RepID=UPI001F0834C7|nr:cartilage intermediate layer protein 1-like isoform X2 [Hypomesus transpacificus]